MRMKGMDRNLKGSMMDQIWHCCHKSRGSYLTLKILPLTNSNMREILLIRSCITVVAHFGLADRLVFTSILMKLSPMTETILKTKSIKQKDSNNCPWEPYWICLLNPTAQASTMIKFFSTWSPNKINIIWPVLKKYSLLTSRCSRHSFGICQTQKQAILLAITM